MANPFGFTSIWLANNNWLDSIGPNDGTPSGGVSFGSPGHPPGSTHFGLFDGINGEVNCGNDSSLAFTDTMSSILWYYSTNGAGTGLFYKGLNFQNGDYALKTNPSNQIQIVINDLARLTSNTILAQNSWNQVGYTFDRLAGSNNLILYHNGLPVSFATYAEAIQVSSDPFKIGRYYTSNFSFKGRLDQIALSNEVLTPEDFVDIYNGGVGIDILAALAAGRRRRILTR